MKALIEELTILQSKTIGLFKNKYTKVFELVIEADEIIFTTITIGDLAGLQTTHYPTKHESDHGQLKIFPSRISLLTMMKEIEELDYFIKSFR